MSMVLLLTDRLGALDTGTLGRLAGYGITSVTLLENPSVTLLEDPSTSGVLLQGWAFDHSTAPEIVEILVPGDVGVRVLQPVMQVSVSAQTGVQIGDTSDRTEDVR